MQANVSCYRCFRFLRLQVTFVDCPSKKDVSCPPVLDDGWGHSRPQDTSTTRHASLSPTELEACSAMHCMGAVEEVACLSFYKTYV